MTAAANLSKHAQARQLRLHVNGELKATTKCWSTSYVPGPFQIGGAGGVDEVRAYFGVIAGSRILAMRSRAHPKARAAAEQGSPEGAGGIAHPRR